MKSSKYERLGYWTCVLILAGFALACSMGIANSLSSGKVQALSKAGAGRTIFQSSDPVGFYAALVPYMLICAAFAWGAHWIWSTYLRRQ
ncbi:hypothetical protein [Acidovorax sp. BLS4]|uniref:hypothetical protein n=1 Tax=Acidovorax sp. BLS4 TaxID=3273430 RepID=UPI0029429D39|nr:hypothetical protein [Paracidovorax avenae]WOI47967.1 hypothetical protein R1Z03_12450 [Paracidovorax avenae]